MNFSKIYWFDAVHEIEKGETVFCVDKQKREVLCLNDLKVKEVFDILNCCKNEDLNRYDFWIEKETAVVE